MGDSQFLLANERIDTAALEDELKATLVTRRAQGQWSETVLDLVYSGRLDYALADDKVDTLRSDLDTVLQLPPLSANFRPVSVHRCIGPLIQRFKTLAVWAVRGLAADLAQQQQVVNQTEAALLARIVASLEDKVDRHAPEGVHGFDRAQFYQSLSYPDPFPAEAVAALVPAGARVWELGCGVGELLRVLRGDPLVGVESSPGCVRYVEAAGLPVVHQDLLDFLDERQGTTVDVAILSRVVDHFDTALLCRVLTTIRSRLAPEGMLLLVSGPRTFIERDVLTRRFYPYAGLTALLSALDFTVEPYSLAVSRIEPLAAATEPCSWYGLVARVPHAG